MNDITIETLVREERNFLHDLSSPLMIAMGMISVVEEDLKADCDQAVATKISKASKAMARMSDLLKAERKKLVALGIKEPQG